MVGPGPVAAVGCELDGHPCTLLAQRAAGSGRVAFAAYPAEEESAGAWWTESGDAVGADAEVALAEDEAGRVVAATLSCGDGGVAGDASQGGGGACVGGMADVLDSPAPLGARRCDL